MQTTLRRAAVAFAVLAVSVPLLAANLGSSVSNEGFAIELNSMERKGNVVTVKWTVKNDNDKDTRYHIILGGERATSYLVDEENGTKYYALTDKEGHLLATEDEYEGIWESIEPGKSKRFWAKFPAPPPAVKTINLLLTGTEPFESIPITDKQ
jgi:hypothetical protein